MADETSKKKSGGKGVENTLGIVGAVLDLAGPLLLGPDAAGISFGGPFRAGAQMFSQKREEDTLLEALGSNPETAPLLELGTQAADAGGLLNVLGSMQRQPPSSVEQAVSAGAPTDFGGADFIRSIAQGDPKFAKQLILASAEGDTEMDQIKQLLTLQLLGKRLGSETSEQKRKAAAKIAEEKEQRLTKQQQISNANKAHAKAVTALNKNFPDKKSKTQQRKRTKLQSQLDDNLKVILGKIKKGEDPGEFPPIVSTPTRKAFGFLPGDPKITIAPVKKTKNLTSKEKRVIKLYRKAYPNASDEQILESARANKDL